jgi:predicted small secreted protein
MKSLTLLPALTLLGSLLLTGCAGTDTQRSGAAMGAVGAYSVGALKFREGETGSDGFLVGQHKAEAGR